MAPGGSRRQFGNVVFSRLPVLQAFRHLLPFPADPEVPGMQRGRGRGRGAGAVVGNCG